MKSLNTLIILTICTGLGSGCAAMLKQWQEDTCHYDGAYSEGMNDAQQGKDMLPARLTHSCPDHTLGDVQTGYREGYTAGSGSGVAVITSRQTVTAPTGPRAYPPRQPQCHDQRDCAEGWCRDRGDGVSVCMHKGVAGDACHSTNDCTHSLWCKDPGNGMKACM